MTRAVLLVALTACGSQQAPPQTHTPAPSQTQPQTQTQAPTPSQTLTPTPTPVTCKTNDDCAMSTSRSCCSPCGVPPFADLKSEVDALRRKCSEVECAMRDPQECKPMESIDAYHAECHDAACVAVRNPPPQAPVAPATLTSTDACTRDGDCAVSSFAGCCAGCQHSAYATSKRDLARREQVCAVVDCAMNGEPRCPPIVDPALYRAVCRAGTCAGVKR